MKHFWMDQFSLNSDLSFKLIYDVLKCNMLVIKFGLCSVGYVGGGEFPV